MAFISLRKKHFPEISFWRHPDDLFGSDGTIDALYGHWILGKYAVKREPRWSVIRNVLHWVD